MLTKYIILFFIYSFLGWVMEVCFAFLTTKKFVNRGCLFGPYCPIYGVGCIILILILSKYNNNIFTLFLITFITCTILEYSTSWLMEKIFKLRWWDYSRYKFNINGRVCLETMFPFAIIGTIIVKYFNPLLNNVISNISERALIIMAIILTIIIFSDGILSLIFVIELKKEKKISKKDATEEIKDSAYKMVKDTVKKSVRK